MKTYARIENNIVVEIINTDKDIKTLFHPDIVKTFIECDGAAQTGMIKTLNGFEMPISIDIDLKQSQYNAIDAHILATIKQNGDYDSLGELELYRNNSEFYKPEAQALIDWVLVCHGIQSSIMTGEQQFDSVDDAIAALPIV